MKIRMNYVSNSSSSSFIIIGIRINNPLKAIKEGKKVIVHIESGGTSGDAEDWSMELNEESYELLKNSKYFKNREDRAIYFEADVNACMDDNNEEILHVLNDIKGKEIFYFDRDYSSPDSKEGLLKFLGKE